MTDTFLKLGQQVLSVTTPVTVYTSSGAQSIVRHIRVVNTDTVARTITLFDGGSGVGNTILPATTIQQGGVLEMDIFITMASGGTILATASAANVLVITLYGMQIT
jgi:hypothetical protein